MQTLLIIFFSIVLAGIIISPFFWLKFLKKKSVWGYLVGSTVVTVLLFLFYATWLYDFVLKYVNSYDVLYYFDRISMDSMYLVILFIILLPFVFTKNIRGEFNVKNFLVSLFLSFVIFISIFLYWAYVLLPQAFSQLHNYF